ncbi:MAG: FtsX-like permease family protein [Bdellovibrionota bacterium]
MNDLLKLAWRNLFRNPRRTLASVVTVGLGAAGLLVYQGFNTGIMNQYRENTIHGHYGYGQVFPSGYYQKVLEKPWEAWIENWPEVEKQIKSVTAVNETFPRVSFYSFLVKGGVTLGGHGDGILSERENKFFNQLNFIAGENLQEGDWLVLGKGLAESLDAKVGDTITLLAQTIHGQLNGVDVRVSGIFHTGVKTIDDIYFRLNLKTAQDLLNTDRIESFSLDTKGVNFWDEVARGIVSINPNLEPIRFEILDKVYYQNSIDFLQAQFGFIRAIIILIVALGIFNTIAVGLLERGGEVGALRANGESRSRLFKIFIIESSFIGILGGVVGVIIAFIMWGMLSKGIPMPPGPGITRQYLIYLEIMPSHLIQALILPAVTAVLASLWPILKLLRKSIPDLLRTT